MRRPQGGKVPTKLGRLRRQLGFDRNGMRRRIDRVQWAVGLALAVVFLMAAPILAMWAGSWSYASGMRTERYEQATRWQVVATVTGPGGVGGERYLSRTVQATWWAPDGRSHTGQIPAWKDAVQGARQALWVDRTGRPVARPQPHSRTVVDAGYAATGAMLAAGLPLLSAYYLVRRRCDRVRDALWDDEWARIDPHRIS
jgi:hypothetical protein